MRAGLLGLNWIHCLALVLLPAPYARAADVPHDLAHAFQASIASKIESTVKGEKQNIEADTKIAYTWQIQGRNRVLSFDSIQGKFAVDGKETVMQFMSRTKYGTGETVPDPLKKMLEASFGAPVLALEFDASGKEVKRMLLLDAAKSSLIDNSQISTVLFFHPPFFSDRQEWQADAELSLGKDNVAKGKLTYTRLPNDKGSPATRVSGTLTSVGVKSRDGSPDIKDVRYVVSGEQTYNSAQQEWTSGKLSIDVSFQLTEDGQALGSATGKMLLNSEMLPARGAAELPPPQK